VRAGVGGFRGEGSYPRLRLSAKELIAAGKMGKNFDLGGHLYILIYSLLSSTTTYYFYLNYLIHLTHIQKPVGVRHLHG
jgi:hypothetical protein